MLVGLIGAGSRGQARARTAARSRVAGLTGVADRDLERARSLAARYDVPAFTSVLALVEQADVVCVAVPTLDHFLIAETAARAGRHVFLEWPPAVSVAECRTLVEIAEEAGVEIGVSSPLRFHPLLDCLPDGWRPTLVHLRYDVDADDGDGLFRWPHVLGAALDLCARLVGSEAVRRVDAAAVRTGALLDTAAVNLRYHRGACAQVLLRRFGAPPARTLYLAGDGVHVEADLDASEAVVRRAGSEAGTVACPGAPPLHQELDAFLEAVAARRPVPFSALEALRTMELVERVQARLR